MEFYYLTTVPSLDLSIKEKTPVQFKLNTPIPTPEPSVGKLFKFNNKKGIIGHVDNIGENIDLSYLFVISNQSEEEDRMEAENIVKGTVYGKLKVAPNSEYTFTKPKEGSPTILTPIGIINTDGIYNLQVEYNTINDTLETVLARELEKYNPNINLEKLSRYLDTFGKLVRVSDKETLFNDICPAMKLNRNQCYTSQYLQKNPPSKKQKSIINRIKGLVERITLDFSPQKQSELEYFDQRLEKSLVGLGLKPVDLKNN